MSRKSKLKPIKDRRANARGGTSQFYEISCSACGTHIVTYQKDGPGSLIKLYLDRIFAPEEKAALQSLPSETKIPNLNCPKCTQLIATPMVYEKENRRAYRLVRGSFGKFKK